MQSPAVSWQVPQDAILSGKISSAFYHLILCVA